MPEKKSSKLLIPAIGATVLVAAGIGAYMYLKGGVTGGGLSPLASAKIVPDDAVAAAFITTDPQAWGQLQKFGTPEAQQLVGQSWQNLHNNVLPGPGYSYEQDLKPWVGNVMVAMMPPATGGQPAQNVPQTNQGSTLMVVGIKDKLSAANFANKLKAQKGAQSKEIDFKGKKITETISPKGAKTYSAVLNDHVVVSDNQKNVEEAIATTTGEPSFASKQGANALLAKPVDVKNSLAQIYIPDYGATMQKLLASSPNGASIPQASLQQLKQVKSMVAGIGVDDAGLRMKAVADLDPQLVKFQYPSSPGQMLGQFPAETFALATGKGINQAWTAFVEQSKSNPQLQQGLDQTRSQLKAANIDLDKDIFSWMDGEFGFGAIPSQQGILAQLGFGGAMVFDTSDRKTAEATLAKLDNIGKAQRLNVAQRNVGSKQITEWQYPGVGGVLAHGWVDNDTVFIAFGGPIADVIANPPSQALNNSDTFKTVTGSLQQPNSGYFYLDMDKAAAILNDISTKRGQPLPPDVKAVVDSIRGLGVTAMQPNNSTSQMEMLLALKPKK